MCAVLKIASTVFTVRPHKVSDKHIGVHSVHMGQVGLIFSKNKSNS